MFYGVDGCRGGWCLAELDADGVRGLEVVPTFAEVARRVADAAAPCVRPSKLSPTKRLTASTPRPRGTDSAASPSP